jgi:hypothetical protein
MDTTIDKILKLLKMNDKSKNNSVKLYAEMKLDDGRVIATEDEQFMIGSKVFVVSDDGSAEALPKGEYTMENGNKMSIGDESEVMDLGEDKEEEGVEASETKEEMEESVAEETDWAKTFEEMKDRVAALEEMVFGKKGEEETEELSVEENKEPIENETEEKTEMSSEDIIGELMTQVEELNNKVVELSKEPATQELKYNPEGHNFGSTINLANLSTKERAAYYINNK